MIRCGSELYFTFQQPWTTDFYPARFLSTGYIYDTYDTTHNSLISLICIETCSEIGLIELTVRSYYKSCAVVGKPRDATVNFDRYGIMFSFDTIEAVDMAKLTC